MLNRSLLLRAGLAACTVSLALGGCALVRPSQKVEIFEAALSAAQEVPPAASSGSGQAEVQFDTLTQVMKWKVNYTGLTGPVTGAHIHGPAGPGQNAGIAVPFGGNLNASPIQGEARLTPQQADQLMSGQWYVNLHTAANPGGEIRGQLRVRR
jgi:hypothetical protein